MIEPINEEEAEKIIEKAKSKELSIENALKLYTSVKKAEKNHDLRNFFPKEKAEKQTYSQDWGALDKAKTNQDQLFRALLEELLFLSIPDEPKKTGRNPYTQKERLFAMCVYVFYKFDMRWCMSMLKLLKDSGHIARVPCYKSISNFFNDESLIQILDDLILINALPLAHLEETCGMDATGFSTSRFDRWFNYKWGKLEGKERLYRKAHVFAGCRTNVVLSVGVTEKNVGDVSMVEEVLGKKLELFDMKNFVADKAYSSRRIMQFLYDSGVMPFIPFKINHTGKKKGVYIWGYMYEYFKKNNASFMQKYHARSNLETVMHMVKKRFGDSVRTKSLIANQNEIKVKFLCHNLLVLMTECFESKVFVDFESCVKQSASIKN